MGFLSELVWCISDILTCGGLQYLEDSKQKYNNAHEKYHEIGDKINCLYNENRNLLLEIGATTKRSFKALKKAEKMLNIAIKYQIYKGYDSSEISNNTVTRVNKLNDRYSSALSAGVGAISGGALAIGSWTVVSAIGAASTGTAISSLTGVAATNATLAWFGGGALAAGGAGIAGGALVLGGIVAFPLIFIWGFTIHKKARKLEEEAKKIEGILPSVTTEREKAEADNQLIKSQHLSICKACDEFIRSVDDANHKLFKLGLVSQFFKSVKRDFGFDYYTPEDKKVLIKLAADIDKFTCLFESK